MLRFYFQRPITIYFKTLPTVIDGFLKIGSFLGFLKLFSFAMNFMHQKLFIRELEKKYGEGNMRRKETVESLLGQENERNINTTGIEVLTEHGKENISI